MLRDLIFAFRGFFRNKLFATSAILTIGLGIGSSVVMFTVLSAVLLRPLPTPNPGRLVEPFFLFAGLALVLAWIGIYGVMTYATVMRIREIAIRMALGASPHSILWLVMGRATRLAAAGILLGLSVSWFATRLLRSVLYGISPHSTAVLVAVSLVVCSAAALASYLPARRAMAVDPNAILRSE